MALQTRSHLDSFVSEYNSTDRSRRLLQHNRPTTDIDPARAVGCHVGNVGYSRPSAQFTTPSRREHDDNNSACAAHSRSWKAVLPPFRLFHEKADAEASSFSRLPEPVIEASANDVVPAAVALNDGGACRGKVGDSRVPGPGAEIQILGTHGPLVPQRHLETAAGS